MCKRWWSAAGWRYTTKRQQNPFSVKKKKQIFFRRNENHKIKQKCWTLHFMAVSLVFSLLKGAWLFCWSSRRQSPFVSLLEELLVVSYIGWRRELIREERVKRPDKFNPMPNRHTQGGWVCKRESILVCDTKKKKKKKKRSCILYTLQSCAKAIRNPRQKMILYKATRACRWYGTRRNREGFSVNKIKKKRTDSSRGKKGRKSIEGNVRRWKDGIEREMWSVPINYTHTHTHTLTSPYLTRSLYIVKTKRAN